MVQQQRSHHRRRLLLGLEAQTRMAMALERYAQLRAMECIKATASKPPAQRRAPLVRWHQSSQS